MKRRFRGVAEHSARRVCGLFHAGALAVAAPTVAWAAPETGESEKPDKSQYTLLNPTPRRYLRELSADRPDKTDSAFTVDAGHFQIEMDFANLTSDRHNPDRTDVRKTAYEVAPMNLKIGLLNNLDGQLTLSPYRWEQTEDTRTGTVERRSGFGDITPRVKVNLVGNDGGFFALALIPFVKLPVNRSHVGNGSVEGGLKVPCAFDVPGWEVGFQTEVDCNRNEANAGYHAAFVNSISVGHSVTGKLSCYAEFYSSVSTERRSNWVGTVDTWITCQLNGNLRLDAGVYIGLTRAAEDWHPFLGMTWRF